MSIDRNAYCSKFHHDVLLLQPRDHVEHEEIPVLEAPIQDRLAIFGLIVFMQSAEAFKVAPEEGDRLFRQRAGIVIDSRI